MTSDDVPDAARTEPEARKSAVKVSTVIFGCLVAAAGAFGLYEIARPPGKNVAHSGMCARSLDVAQALDPLTHGEVAALTLATLPLPLDAVAFDDSDGRKTTVAAFKGRAILLNIWATWCVPCRAEMPSLDRLQASLGSDRFSVVPVNVDTARLDKPRAFLKEIGATTLPFFSDNTADIIQVLKQNQRIDGLPTTILIGGDGCMIGTMAGPADWASPDAKALIEKLERADAEKKAV